MTLQMGCFSQRPSDICLAHRPCLISTSLKITVRCPDSSKQQLDFPWCYCLEESRPTDWSWKQVRKILDRYLQPSKAEVILLSSLRFGFSARITSGKWDGTVSKCPQQGSPLQAIRLVSSQMSYFQSLLWLKMPPAPAELCLNSLLLGRQDR